MVDNQKLKYDFTKDKDGNFILKEKIGGKRKMKIDGGDLSIIKKLPKRSEEKVFLLKLVQDAEYIWDKKNKKYNSLTVRNAFWRDVSQKFKSELDIDVDGGMIIKKY